MSEGQELTLGEVATRLRLHPETVRRWLNSGRLPGYRLGGTKAGWRIREADLEDFKRRAAESHRPKGRSV